MVLVALSYAVTAELASLLGTPPGLIAPFWPSAAIALVATLRWGRGILPAIFVGGFAVHFEVLTFERSLEHFEALALTIVLSGAGVVHAVVGAMLVGRTVRALTLHRSADVVRFFLHGGPVACFFSATLSTLALHAAGVVPRPALVDVWVTDWLGTSIGVIAAAPLLLIAFGLPRDIWRARARRVGIPLAAATCVFIGLLGFAREWENENAAAAFTTEASRCTAAIERDVQVYRGILRSIERYFSASTFVDSEEFRTYVGELIRTDDGIRALQWVPRVARKERGRYEAGRLIEGVRHEIRELAPDGGLSRAGDRDDYYPVTYVEPRLGHAHAFGFDLGSTDDRRRAIERARDSGTLAGTAPIELVLDNGRRTGVLLFQPIYATGDIPATLEARRASFLGVAGGVFLPDDIVDGALAGVITGAVSGRILDRATGVEILCFGPRPDGDLAPEPDRVAEVDFVGRPWTIETTMTAGLGARFRSFASWTILIAGAVLLSLLAGFLLLLDGTIGRIEDEVEERTCQLALIIDDLEAARLAADDANKVKSEFLANMSHEIRTPLTAILGFGENLREDELPDAQRIEAIDAIVSNGDHLLQLINDILDISKIEAGKLEVETLEVDIVDLVRRTGAIIESKMSEKGIDFRIEFITRMPRTVQTDPTRVQQMLINLLGNSVKFSPARSTILVTVALSELETPVGPAPALDFCVFDSGIGMSKEQVSRLFRPFSQAEASTARRFGGTGLGLAITRQLCEMLGGEVVVTSEEGRGTAFRLTIPTGSLEGVAWVDPDLDPVYTAGTRPGSRARKKAAPAEQRIESRILLAEDGIDNQKLLRFVLERAGATVDIAEHGGIALSMLREAEEAGTPYDLLLTDMQMPEMDGFELVSRLRSDGCVLPIVALTASAMEGDRDRCLSIGCDDYATKPIDRTALIGTIRSQLQRTGTSTRG